MYLFQGKHYQTMADLIAAIQWTTKNDDLLRGEK